MRKHIVLLSFLTWYMVTLATSCVRCKGCMPAPGPQGEYVSVAVNNSQLSLKLTDTIRNDSLIIRAYNTNELINLKFSLLDAGTSGSTEVKNFKFDYSSITGQGKIIYKIDTAKTSKLQAYKDTGQGWINGYFTFHLIMDNPTGNRIYDNLPVIMSGSFTVKR